MNEGSKAESPEDSVSSITGALAGLLARVWGFEAWANCAQEADAAHEGDLSKPEASSKKADSGPVA
jgi:hypothetical protein